MRITLQAFAALVAIAIPLSQAIELDVTDSASIKNATSVIAYGLMKYYKGNITNTETTVGILPQPYYWWEAGAMWGALLDYYHFTGDSTYNEVTTQALLSQGGPLYDYMVPLQQKDEGNDDQAFWGFATMSAAEKNYPQPTVGNYSWVQLTENLWNTQVRRWNNTQCNGGLKWQIFPSNNGYDYKNSVSNGAFFQLSARLARFTGNQTYVEWAEKSLQWSQDIGLITDDWHVYDGTDDTKNCTEQDQIIWTYNSGIYLYGSAVMYNYTNASSIWETRTRGFLNAAGSFFSPYNNATNIMYELACETVHTCDNDQYSFKAYLSRFMWASTLMAPFTTAAVTTLLQASSSAAAQACSGGFDGVTCGEHWYYGAYDGIYGVGQQMSALETLQGLLIQDSIPPLHSDQVQLMVPATTGTASTAPVPSSTYSPSSYQSSSQTAFTSYGSGTSMSSSVIQGTQINSVPFVSASSPLPSSASLSSSTLISSSASSSASMPSNAPILSNYRFPIETNVTAAAESATATASPTVTQTSDAGKRFDLGGRGSVWLGFIGAGVWIFGIA